MNHHNKHLQQIYESVGFGAFNFYILEILPKNIDGGMQTQIWLRDRENIWIEHYKRNNSSLNAEPANIVVTRESDDDYKNQLSKFANILPEIKRNIKIKIDSINEKIDKLGSDRSVLHNKARIIQNYISDNSGLINLVFSTSENRNRIKEGRHALEEINADIKNINEAIQAENIKLKMAKKERRDAKYIYLLDIISRYEEEIRLSKIRDGSRALKYAYKKKMMALADEYDDDEADC